MSAADDNDELYQQVILDHNRKPRNFGKLESPSHAAEGFNPLCGDHLWVYLDIGADEVIREIKFDGSGCAISKASASMMTASLKGKTVAEARRLMEEFQRLLKGELDQDNHHLGKLTIFAGVWKYPVRIKCAVLGWYTLRGALENAGVVSTE